MSLLAKRSGNPNSPGGGRGSPGFPQIGDKSRFSGVRFSGNSPNPNCLARDLTLSGSRRIRFFIISGRAQIAGIRVANDPVTSVINDIHNKIMSI